MMNDIVTIIRTLFIQTNYKRTTEIRISELNSIVHQLFIQKNSFSMFGWTLLKRSQRRWTNSELQFRSVYGGCVVGRDWQMKTNWCWLDERMLTYWRRVSELTLDYSTNSSDDLVSTSDIVSSSHLRNLTPSVFPAWRGIFFRIFRKMCLCPTRMPNFWQFFCSGGVKDISFARSSANSAVDLP